MPISAMATCLVLVGIARAQVPAEVPDLTAPAIPIEAVTQTWWIAQDVNLERWPDGGPTVEPLATGTEVELILREGERVRVRKDLSFGWVPAAAVSDQPPAAAAATP